MLLATKTLGATGGAGVAGGGVGVEVALGVAITVAVGLVEGAELAALGVPQAASTTGAMTVSSALLVISCLVLIKGGGRSGGRAPSAEVATSGPDMHSHKNLARERDIPNHTDLYPARLLACAGYSRGT